MRKIRTWFKEHRPTKRRIIQLYAALLFNANLKGFGNGKIYQGKLKNICAPGLNCYSCPGASAACPLGALQNSLASADKTLPYYMFGIIMLYGLLAGRWICGFLCPFGLIQELLHKIKTPKLKKGRITRVLSYFKYVILVVFVFIFPLLYMFRNFPLPGFCKYICPAGTLEGAIGLLSNEINASSFRMLGPIFTWKFILMVSFIVGSVFIYRFFCRFFCPLGALYGFFNKICFFGIKLDKPKCIDCGLCVSKCKMDIRHVGDHECISCGECIDVCPTKAIRWKGSKPYLSANEIEGASTAEEAQAIADAHNQKQAKKNKIVKICVGVSMALLLVGALVYYNFIDKAPGTEPPKTQDTTPSDTTPGDDGPVYTVGNAVGNLCYGKDIALYGEGDEIFNVSETRGKITVINFWYTTCGPCIEELPHFNEVATEYKDDVVVVAIHADMRADVPGWIAEHYPETDMVFGFDEGNEYYFALGGNGSYPMTVMLDENGVIIHSVIGSVTEDELNSWVGEAVSKMKNQ